MDATFILRNKQFNELNKNEKQIVINEVRQAYLVDNLKIDDLIKKFNSTKTFMYKFLRDNDIKKSQEQLNAERSNTCKQAYNNKSKGDLEKIKEKRKQTNLEKYGVENCYQSEEIKQKIKDTCLEKYGVEHHTQREDVKRKIDNSIINSQGAKRYLQTEQGQQKYKDTCLKKYGVENPYQSEEKKDKIKATNLERYGYEYAINNPTIQQKYKQTIYQKYGVENISQLPETQLKAKATNLNRYGVERPILLHPNKNRLSKLNLGFKDLIKNELDIDLELEFNLNNKYYDFKYNKLLIELNPTISHNSSIAFPHLVGRCKETDCIKHKPLPKKYHYDKWQNAKDNGYELISIFDWYDKDRILSLIKSKLQCNDIKIGARQTTIKKITKQESKVFLDNNHILGHDIGTDMIYGLYYKNLLVSVMTFGKPRYNKDYEWELLRFANLSNYTIYGAASKLWNQFIKDYEPKSVITYTNNDFGNGAVYEKLGFKFDSLLKSSCVWNKPYSDLTIKHTSLIRQGADRLLKNKINNYFSVGLDYNDFVMRGGKEEYKEEYSLLPNDTNWWPGNIDIMKHYGLLEVYTSGTSVYVYQTNKD